MSYLRASASVPTGIDSVSRKRQIACEIFPSVPADEALVRTEYQLCSGRPLDFHLPDTLSAKLHWLKFNDRRPLYGRLVDKAAARQVVADRASKNLLTDLRGVYQSTREVPWLELDGDVIVKATHGWNMNLPLREGDQRPPDSSVLAMVEGWLAVRHELRHAEWAYSLVPARLLVEELLKVPGGDLVDYKFFCFGGEPRFLKVDVGRRTLRTQGYLDLNWDPLPFHNPRVPPLVAAPRRPSTLATMIEVSRALSAGLPFVRVDLYEYNGEVKFGEFTLYPCGGNLWFAPVEWNFAIGELLPLPRTSDSGAGSLTSAE